MDQTVASLCPRVQFQALQQEVRAKENDALTRQVIYYRDTIAIATI